MKKFLLKILAFVLIGAVCTVAILLYEFNSKNYYTPLTHMMNVKRCAERLDTLNGQKIIFIGGSGCGFGIKSEIISRHFKMPVVNTGTHASIGLRLQMEIFKKYISKDDIVVAIPEYSNYSELFYLGNNEPPLEILSVYPEALKVCPFWQKIYLAQFIPKFYKAKDGYTSSSQPYNSPYCINSLNDYGDITYYDERSKSKDIVVYKPLEKYNPLVKIYIKNYKKDVENRGAHFILLPPALSNSSFKNSQDFINDLYKEFNESGDTLFADTPEVCSLPDSLYYDTPYHLTTKGIEIRSNILINQIERVLSKTSSH